MAGSTKSQTRLFVVLARNAPVGVVFRRGPSRHVLLRRWDLRNDTFEHGQWLKCRIYERRCDLSPDGDLLIYFAANYKRPLRSWTAISRPPYLTALALWKKGDGWGGGGLFSKPNEILLNHRSDEMSLGDGFTTPRQLSVKQFGERPGWGEDEPIWSTRLKRDGWNVKQWPELPEPRFGEKVVWQLDPPIIWEKPHPLWPSQFTLQMAICGFLERNGPTYLIDYDLHAAGIATASLGRCDWADWDPNGDLLFAQSGCIYRLSPEKKKFPPIELSRVIADFGGMKFENVTPPPEATEWPKNLRSKRK
jgi:hypothetical protein